jgi:dihydroorotase
VFGIAGKGRMAEGYDADLTLVDLKAKHVLIRHADMASRCGWTPFDGFEADRQGPWPRSSAAASS